VAKRKVEDQFRAADPTKPVTSLTVGGDSRPTIERAVTLFVSSKRSQGLDDGVLKKYDRELGRFAEFMSKRSRFFPHEIRLEDVTEFRADWDTPSTPHPPHGRRCKSVCEASCATATSRR
jgi:hypothetical protein